MALNLWKPLPWLTVVLGVLAALAQPAVAQMLCVNVPRANLRDGPGPGYPITWEAHQYMPLLRVKEEADWLQVRDVDGDLHWIHSQLVTDQVQCVTIKAPRANIRTRPNFSSQVWFTVEKYFSFRLTAKKGKWAQLDHHGETMWVYRTLIWPD